MTAFYIIKFVCVRLKPLAKPAGKLYRQNLMGSRAPHGYGLVISLLELPYIEGDVPNDFGGSKI